MLRRRLLVFGSFAGGLLALGVLKAILVGGLATLPPIPVLVLASSTLGLVAVLIDWAFVEDLVHGKSAPQRPVAAVPHGPKALEQAQRRPIVFSEICPPAEGGLSFYGGVPVGPGNLSWPRRGNALAGAPLSFVMQWDCHELARQDATGLLPADGVLYLFGDLSWGEPFDFRFLHASGPSAGWQALPVPAGLGPIYGDEGVYQVPYCSSQIAKDKQAVPHLLPRWGFVPVAISYPIEAGAEDEEAQFWNDGETVAAALLRLAHPEGAPQAPVAPEPPTPFARPFPEFPHDWAAVRVVAGKVLDRLKRPSYLLREVTEEARATQFAAWREEAIRQYEHAATHPPAARLEPARADEIWRWMEGVEPVLGLGWGETVTECVNVSLGFAGNEGLRIPEPWIQLCVPLHRLASVYWRKPNAGEAMPPEGTGVQAIHAPTPNRMFGPPSYVQGGVEEYVKEWILLLELSSRRSIGMEFGEGVLQFLIRPEDLRQRRWDQVKLVAGAY